MGHDATKVLMGSTQSSSKQGSEVFASDPATYLAGLAVRRTSSNLLSLTKSAGRWAGISLGRSLSDTKKTTVLNAGERVPLLLSRQPARGYITIDTFANLLTTTPDSFTVGATVFTAQSTAVSHGGATFRAATSDNATAISLADQINNHATASTIVVASVDTSDNTKVNITAKSNTTSGDTIALAYTDNGSETGGAVSGATLTDSDDTADFVAIGAPVYISDDTGKADDPNSAATISNAVYVSEEMVGVNEDGTEVACVLVDMAGGL